MRNENRLIFPSRVARRFFFKGKNIRANLEFMLTVDTQKIVAFATLVGLAE